ncbi:MAG: DUF3368 domain-containing protein [Hormoscilla sp.]
MIVVSNTSPITSLAAINQLQLLQQLYGSIIIPEAVYRELTDLDSPVPGTSEVQTYDWIEMRQVENKSLVIPLRPGVDEGEAEAIALAIELHAELLLIDDLDARIQATRLGLDFTGLLGVLIEAKNQGLIPAVKPVLNELIAIASFRVGQALYHRVLQIVGE